MRTYNWKRNEEIHKLVQQAYSYREIAKLFSMSHTNVARIFRLHRLKLKEARKTK